MRSQPFTSAVVAVALVAPLTVATQASASTTPSGGAAVPSQGGARYGETPRVHGLASLPRLTLFRLSSPTLTATASYRFAAPRSVRKVRVQLLAAKGSRVVKTFALGSRRPGRIETLRVRAKGLAPGTYRVRILAASLRTPGVTSVVRVTVPAPAPPRPPASAPTPASAPSTAHVFPVRGPSSFGGSGGRFGAARPGHTHQGQDLTAAEGVPLVSPHAGRVKAARYQAGGAGYYVVIDSAGEDRDYVFMHLRAGSTVVTEGQLVKAGQQIGQVGNTGASEGAHLHFEIWTGRGWYSGGRPVDPLPYLRAWARR
ncbi:MAG: M23 family metallopeptidase [Thermoleophilaceae bacterium]